jgi:hypothetical protein
MTDDEHIKFTDQICALDDQDLISELLKMLQDTDLSDVDRMERCEIINNHMLTRMFIARICMGHIVALNKEMGEFSPMTKDGFLSHKDYITNMREGLQNLADMIDALINQDTTIEEIESCGMVKIDSAGNIIE